MANTKLIRVDPNSQHGGQYKDVSRRQGEIQPMCFGRNLDTHHLEARLPLPIDSSLQAKGPELVVGDSASTKLQASLLEDADLLFDCFPRVPGLDFCGQHDMLQKTKNPLPVTVPTVG